jgi:hypothetical protein
MPQIEITFDIWNSTWTASRDPAATLTSCDAEHPYQPMPVPTGATHIELYSYSLWTLVHMLAMWFAPPSQMRMSACITLTERPEEAKNDNVYCHRAIAGQGLLQQALACVPCAFFHAGW